MSDFGCYNHGGTSYYVIGFTGFQFFVVGWYLFLESDFSIYCELKFGHKLEYCNLYFIIVD